MLMPMRLLMLVLTLLQHARLEEGAAASVLPLLAVLLLLVVGVVVAEHRCGAGQASLLHERTV